MVSTVRDSTLRPPVIAVVIVPGLTTPNFLLNWAATRDRVEHSVQLPSIGRLICLFFSLCVFVCGSVFVYLFVGLLVCLFVPGCHQQQLQHRRQQWLRCRFLLINNWKSRKEELRIEKYGFLCFLSFSHSFSMQFLSPSCTKLKISLGSWIF